MTQQTANSHAINNSARCQHFYPNGRRCRLSSTTHPNFCSTHAPLPQNRPAPEIASLLTAELTDFTSAVQINDFLARLLLLLAQDKISTRRAAVLAYITNQLLRTLPAIANEDGPGRKAAAAFKSAGVAASAGLGYLVQFAGPSHVVLYAAEQPRRKG